MSTSRLGAHYLGQGQGTRFLVWAPKAKAVTLELNAGGQKIELAAQERGYFGATVADAKPGDRYTFSLDGKEPLADPASRHQPEGVHGSSEVVDSNFEWRAKDWRGVDERELVFYEIHVGTFTASSDFEGIIAKLPYLKELGVTALEIMPIAQFPGKWNWGYDGVFPFAAQNTYGGPLAFKRLIDAAHLQGLGVFLDVVYNHLGPEGNRLPDFGPYFQSKYKTPWGEALNYDGAGSDEVRRYFIENAMQWLEEFRCDGLRMDAIHAICDLSAAPFLEKLSRAKNELVQRTGRSIQLIGETDMNDARILQPADRGGLGLDGHWNDDFHHVVHSLLTGEEQGYYKGYRNLSMLAQCFERGVVYEGQYQPSRQCSHGRPYGDIARHRLVICTQNHDQTGNRMRGDRLSTLVSPEKLELAAATMLLSPFAPLLFMGEEYGETSPFQYFIDHEDADLVEAVRKGRREEFSSFAWEGETPDPASIETVDRSRLNWKLVEGEANNSARKMLDWYRALIKASRWLRTHGMAEAGALRAEIRNDVLTVRGERPGAQLWAAFSFSSQVQRTELPPWLKSAAWSLASSGQAADRGELNPFGVLAAGLESGGEAG